ncbi:Protein TIFY 5A [Abeliophyllum distichum]|uniref:Protein TIFY n=1 Tax=Abeliophyllum distichum TaxID=126358 RepID=A0ABD1UIY4_9LAMI
MKRNCNLQLRLVTPSVSFNSTDNNGNYHPPMLDMVSGNSNEKQQPLTIFYNGRMLTACDVTELQARSIISLASQEMEKSNTPPSCGPLSPLLQSPLYTPTGNSMKRSLQRFLQKRKTRAQEAFPYHH